MNRTETLISIVLKNSQSDDFEEARKEWELDYLEYIEDRSGECICKQKNITNLVHIKNKINNKVLQVGANCASETLLIKGINLNFYSTERDRYKVLQGKKKLFCYDIIYDYYRRNLITEWDYNFYRNMYSKNFQLTEKQDAQVERINNKIKSYMSN